MDDQSPRSRRRRSTVRGLSLQAAPASLVPVLIRSEAAATAATAVSTSVDADTFLYQWRIPNNNGQQVNNRQILHI